MKQVERWNSVETGHKQGQTLPLKVNKMREIKNERQKNIPGISGNLVITTIYSGLFGGGFSFLHLNPNCLIMWQVCKCCPLWVTIDDLRWKLWPGSSFSISKYQKNAVGTKQPTAGETAEHTQSTGQQKIKQSIWARIGRRKDGKWSDQGQRRAAKWNHKCTPARVSGLKCCKQRKLNGISSLVHLRTCMIYKRSPAVIKSSLRDSHLPFPRWFGETLSHAPVASGMKWKWTSGTEIGKPTIRCKGWLFGWEVTSANKQTHPSFTGIVKDSWV